VGTGADVNAEADNGLPLHTAVKIGTTKFLKLLLEKGMCYLLRPQPFVLALLHLRWQLVTLQ
jgi:hypothetical protein